MQAHQWDDAILAAERLSEQPGWEARGSMMLGTIRVELNNIPGAAESFRRALELDPSEVDRAQQSDQASQGDRPDLSASGQSRRGRVAVATDRGQRARQGGVLAAEPRLSSGRGQDTSTGRAETGGLLPRRQPARDRPRPVRGRGPLREVPRGHLSAIRSPAGTRRPTTVAARSTRSPIPERPLPDPDDPQVTHAFQRRDGVLHEETRVGNEVFDAVIEYAFGTSDRYLTAVSRDANGGYHIARLSYYQTAEGKGWDRSTLDTTHATRAHPADFQGESIGVRDGLAKCLYCHVTNPRTGHDSMGPEMADRAIGCERCHGPGGNHIAALQLGLPDSAIVNPAGASPETVTSKQCNDCHILQRNFAEDPENPGWIRSQGVGWARSRCNTESGGTFGCVTCHNPHQTASATSSSDYEAKCVKCHSPTGKPAEKEKTTSTAQAGGGPPYRTCPVNRTSGCLGCHMPRVKLKSLHAELTDHYIRVRGQKR